MKISSKKEYIDQVYEIDKASVPIPWSKNSIEEEMNNMLAKFVVAKEDDEVVGFAMCWFIMDECHIGNIAVLSEYRNQGIATMLINNLLEDCKDDNLSFSFLKDPSLFLPLSLCTGETSPLHGYNTGLIVSYIALTA